MIMKASLIKMNKPKPTLVTETWNKRRPEAVKQRVKPRSAPVVLIGWVWTVTEVVLAGAIITIILLLIF